MKIEYEIKGITLDVDDLMKVHEYYEAACTAEYLMDNCGIDNEEDALQLGYDVRWLMYKYDLDEETAIDRALEKIKDDDYTPSTENGDYSPSNPWDAPGMSISDFI